jgi:hypothetical protein
MDLTLANATPSRASAGLRSRHGRSAAARALPIRACPQGACSGVAQRPPPERGARPRRTEWTEGQLSKPFTALAAIEFDLGVDFAQRVIDTALYGRVVYAAVRSHDGQEVFGLGLLTECHDDLLYTKPVSEDMGPAEDRCPARILDRLTPPSNEYAREWRERCRERLANPTPRPGQTVIFTERVKFANGVELRTRIFHSGSRFRSPAGRVYHIRSWRERDYTLRGTANVPTRARAVKGDTVARAGARGMDVLSRNARRWLA